MTETPAAPPYPAFDDSALCTQTDRDLFFPTEDGNGHSYRATRARALCARCSWLDPCAEYALHVNVEGVWGGTTYRERQLIRAERGIEIQRASLGLPRDYLMGEEAS